MTHEDVDQIEHKLGIIVPAEYRIFITDYPSEVPLVARGYDLLDHPEYVISENQSVRQSPVWGVCWREHYFVIGHDGTGGRYCIDSHRSPSPVIYFDHEDQSFREVAASLRDWVPQLIDAYAE